MVLKKGVKLTALLDKMMSFRNRGEITTLELGGSV